MTSSEDSEPAPPGEKPGGLSGLSYEQARDQLTDVVRRLESGGLTLEESLELWERGEQLASICARWLDGARARLAAVMPDHNGSPNSETPF